MRAIRHIINVSLFVLIGFAAHAQSEGELKEQAGELFENEVYVKATPLYLQLLSLNPKNPDYNFRYGTCLLYNSYKKQEAIRYLNFAVKESTIDPRAFYFHGKALHLNYQFEEAKASYQKYIKLRSKRDDRYHVEREIEMCDNGKKLLSTFTDIIVSEKQEIDNSKFFRLYRNMQTIGGDILVSAEFQSKIDKKKGHVPIVHFPPNAKAIYYSSYGDDEATGKDIYIRRRLPDGGWGDPQLLPGVVNTNEDEDFPYMHPSGDFLYFSSKGHNSMGGYDVFLARFNPDVNSFTKVENVDFAISSPDDDLFYVVDSLHQNAYFASARQSQNGKLHVYKVRVARVPIQEIIVMGDFLSEINPDNKRMNVEVTSYTNGEKVGNIQSNAKGKYSFVFPKGGKYTYQVTVDGSEDIYKFTIELPFLDEFRPLKQKAIHTSQEGNEIVRIVNLFDEKVEGAEALIAEVIRKKAELDVNVGEFDIQALDGVAKRNEVLAEMGFKNMSLEEVSHQLAELAISEKLNIEKVDRLESNINNEIVEKAKELAYYDIRISELQEKLSTTGDPIEKHKLLNQIKILEQENLSLAKELENLNNLKIETVKSIGIKTESGIRKVELLENQYNALLSAGKEDAALKLLANNSDLINTTRAASPENLLQKLIKKSVELGEENTKMRSEIAEYDQSKDKLESQIKLLNQSLPTAKKKDKARIESEIKEKKSEVELVKEVLISTRSKMAKNSAEQIILDNNIASLQKAMLSDAVADVNENEIKTSIENVNEAIDKNEASTTDQQLLALENSNPELNPDYNPDIVTDVNMFEQYASLNTSEKEQINNNEDLTELEKLESLVATNNKTIEDVKDRLNEIEQLIDGNPENEKIIDEKENLIQLQSDLETENNVNNEKIKELSENISDVAISQEDVLNEIDKNYTSDLEAIRLNENLTEKDKLEQEQELDLKLTQELENEITDLNKQLNKDPEDQEIIARKEIVSEILNQKQDEISERTQSINALNNVSSEVDENAINEELNKELVVEYVDKKNEVLNSNQSDFQKNQDLLELAIEQLATLNEKQAELEKELTRSPDDEIIKTRVGTVTAFILEQEREIEAIKTQAKNAIDSNIVNAKVEELDENYSADIEALKQSNSPTKGNQIGDREFVLQEKLNKEIESKEKELARKYTVTAELEMAVLEKALKESKTREEEARSETTVVETNVGQEAFINEIREEAFGGGENSLEQEYTTKAELEMQEQILAFYESQLDEKLEETKTALENSPEDNLLNSQLTWIEEEKAKVAAKRYNIGISIGELETNVVVSNETQEQFINNVREEAFGGSDNILDMEYTTKDELEKQEQILAFYESQLEEKLDLAKTAFENSPEDKKLESQVEWLKEEKEKVASKRYSIGVSIGELESDVVETHYASEEDDPKLNQLDVKENELLDQLNADDLSKDEKKEILAQLDEVEQEKTIRNNEIHTENIIEGQKDNTNLVAELNSVAGDNSAAQKLIALNNTNASEIEKLKVQADKAKTEEEKMFLLNEIIEKQTKVNNSIQEEIHNRKIENIEETEDVTLLSREELEKRRRTFTVQIGDLTTEIFKTEKKIETAKKRDIEKLEFQKANLIEERSLIETKLHAIEERLVKTISSAPVVHNEAISKEITFNEERKVASEESYQEYYDLAKAALDTEQQIAKLEQDLKAEQNEVNTLLADTDTNPSDERIVNKVMAIKEIQSNIDRLKIELVQQKYVADQALPSNEEEAMKMQNLIARGIRPLKTTVVATALINMPTNGLAVKTDAESVYSVENPIPVDVESPTGLVYRVQIGAFARPIPQNLFKEFNPVSGEKIGGTNITRYMAGFFNNSAAVVDAREQIRGLGYSDAFVVAYCDGKRIGFGDARRREAEGTCVPKGTNEIMLEVAINTAEKLGIPLETEVQEVSETAYNQAPGAAVADPIEIKQGLFFTVQIGVFNRPVGPELTHGMSELMTIRLPNGQIRYATGMFDSVEEALPRRNEALTKGVVGAFVTAYYEGVRITLSEARKLLKKNGPSILQSEIEKAEVVELVEVPENIVRTDTVTAENVRTDYTETEKHRIQIVTKKQFKDFPRDVLNRYNAEGNFFYDAKDSLVKSIIYKDVDDLPRLWNFRDDIDTLYLPFDDIDTSDRKILIVNMADSIIPGDFMDWLLRFNYRREFVVGENGVDLRIYSVEPNEIKKVQSDIRKFNIDAIVAEENETELELEENK